MDCSRLRFALSQLILNQGGGIRRVDGDGQGYTVGEAQKVPQIAHGGNDVLQTLHPRGHPSVHQDRVPGGSAIGHQVVAIPSIGWLGGPGILANTSIKKISNY